MNAVIGKLNTARTRATPLLRADGLATQISAMQDLARAHALAAAAVAALHAGSEAVANRALVQALRMVGSSYRALARDASRRDQRAYRQAQAALASATSALDSRFAALRKLGYRVG